MPREMAGQRMETPCTNQGHYPEGHAKMHFLILLLDVFWYHLGLWWYAWEKYPKVNVKRIDTPRLITLLQLVTDSFFS